MPLPNLRKDYILNSKPRNIRESGGRKTKITLFCRTRNPRPLKYVDQYSKEMEPQYFDPYQYQEWVGVNDLHLYDVPLPKAIRLLAGSPDKFFPARDIVTVDRPRGDGGVNVEKVFPVTVVIDKESKNANGDKQITLKREPAQYIEFKDSKGNVTHKQLVQLERTMLVGADPK